MGPHPGTSKDEAYLGTLAMQFRGTRDDMSRRAIAAEYAKIVKNLIRSGSWKEIPAPEDQLPDDFMPHEFLEFWQ